MKFNCYKQCQICHDSYMFQNGRKTYCSNIECTAFVCNHCLQQWLSEKSECPICHNTDINPIIINQNSPENDIENQANEINCTCNCNCKYNDKPLYIKILVFILLFWILGLSTLSLLTFKRENEIKNLDKALLSPIFHIIIIIWGMFCFMLGRFILIPILYCYKCCFP